MQHFAENELIKSIVHIATENIGTGYSGSVYINPTQHCRVCWITITTDETIFCSECVFTPYKHQTEKTNLAQVNQVLSRIRSKR